MKNLKLNFLLLLLISVFACDTSQMAEDETPIQIRSSIDLVETTDPVDPPPTVNPMVVSVEYAPGTDKDNFRATFDPLLNIRSWHTCPTNPLIEVWTIDEFSEREFRQILDSVGHINGRIILIPKTTGHLVIDDDYAERGNPQGVPIIATFDFNKICY